MKQPVGVEIAVQKYKDLEKQGEKGMKIFVDSEMCGVFCRKESELFNTTLSPEIVDITPKKVTQRNVYVAAFKCIEDYHAADGSAIFI